MNKQSDDKFIRFEAVREMIIFIHCSISGSKEMNRLSDQARVAVRETVITFANQLGLIFGCF